MANLWFSTISGAETMSFKAVQSKIASKEDVSKKAAGAILAARTRAASAGAKKKNPALCKVKGACK